MGQEVSTPLEAVSIAPVPDVSIVVPGLNEAESLPILAEQIREAIGISLQETRFSDKLTVLETLRLFRSFYPSGLTPETAMADLTVLINPT